MPADWRRLTSDADRARLADGLPEHTLYELYSLLSNCEPQDARDAIVAAVIDAIPEYGRRALMVGLARFAAENDPNAVTASGQRAKKI